MTRPGFSLIEILVALAVSSFLMLMIFNTLSLLQHSAKRYKEIIAIDNQQEMLFSQLNKDITGIVVPRYGFIPAPTEKPEEQQKKQTDYYARYGLQIEIENERLKMLTFVTTSVLGSYGVIKPRLARVRYLLLPDEAHPAHFLLVRQESSELALAEFENDKNKNKNFSHTIAVGIKSCALSCTLITQHEGKKKVEEVSSWSAAELMKKQKGSSDQRFEQKIELPQIISLKGTMVDRVSEHAYPFDYIFYVPIDATPAIKPEAKPAQAAKKPDEKGPQKPDQKTPLTKPAPGTPGPGTPVTGTPVSGTPGPGISKSLLDTFASGGKK